MSMLNGIHDLVYCFQRAQGMGSSVLQGNDVGVGLNAGGMVGKGLWYGRNQIPSLQKALKNFSDPENLVAKNGLPTPTAVVDLCMVVISIIDLTFNGFAVPEKGTGFAAATDKFRLAAQSLASAVPDARDWDGAAAQAYSNQNKKLMSLVQDQMLDLNAQMQNLMSNQAAAVTAAKNACAGALLGLVLAQGVALVLYLKPIIGPQLSLYWQIAAAASAMGVVLTYESKAVQNSDSVKDDVKARIDAYNAVAAAAKALAAGTLVNVDTAAAPGTGVGGFTSTRAGAPVPVAPAPHPSAAMVARRATQEQTPLNEPTAVTSTGADGAPPPAATSPRSVTPVNPLAQPRQASPVASRGQRAAPPVETPTIAAAPRAGNEVDHDEAAAGRAPVQGASADATEAQRRASAKRSG